MKQSTRLKMLRGLEARIKMANNLVEFFSKSEADQTSEMRAVKVSLQQEIKDCELLKSLAQTVLQGI